MYGEETCILCTGFVCVCGGGDMKENKGKRRLMHRWEDSIKRDLTETG